MINYGQGVELDTIDQHHLDLLRGWRNDPNVSRWTRQFDLISEREQRHWYEQTLNDPSIRMYLIRANGDNPVGVCGLTSISSVSRRAEFSVYIAPGARTRGYGLNALKTLCSHGFNAIGLNCIWGETFESNKIAKKTFFKLGFISEGIRRKFYFKEGSFINAELVSLLYDDWIKHRAFSDARELCSI